jgi:hypothetical protein
MELICCASFQPRRSKATRGTSPKDSPDHSDANPGSPGPPSRASATASSELVSVLGNLTEVFFTLDRPWCFTDLNAEAEEYLRRTRAGLPGRSVGVECPQLRAARYETGARRAAEQSNKYALELYDAIFRRRKEMHVLPSPNGLAVSCIDTS